MTQRKQAILLFSILMFCYAYVHQGPGWNQNSRLDLLHALFVHKTFKIDAYHENTGDKSIHNGHYYSDKAPGIVFLALPAFALSAGILHLLDVPLDSEKGWLASDWITTAGSVGLITALGGMAMFLFLCRLVEQRYAYITTLAVFLGAAPFPYATMLFSHAAVIGLICIALWAIADDFFMQRIMSASLPAHADSLSSGERTRVRASLAQTSIFGERWLKRHLLAGLCCGLAISSEYTAATAAGGVLALAFLTNWRRGIILMLGAVPPLLLIPTYNWICFGGPLAFGYHHLERPEFQEMKKGLFGITWPPKASAAYLILLSPERGLFFWTPFLLMLFVGLGPLRTRFPKLFWVCSVVVVLHIVCISGYYMPNGGSALGPRHLAPMLPFLMGFTAIGLQRWFVPGCIYAFYSIMVTGFGTIISAMPPPGINPLLDLYCVKPIPFGFSPLANTIPSWAGFSPLGCLATHIVLALGLCVLALLPLIKQRSFETHHSERIR